MMETAEAIVEPPRSLARRVFFDRSETLRSGWALAVFALAFAAIGWPLRTLGVRWGWLPRHPESLALDDPGMLTEAWYRLAITLLASGLAARAVGQRLRDIGFVDSRLPLKLGTGAVAAVVLLSATVLLAVASGHERLFVESTAFIAVRSGAWMLLILTPAAAAEELALRGFPFQQLQRGIGATATVLISGVIFGIAHAGNPNATWIAVANIALGGWLFGLIRLRTGSLWFPIAFHTFWNWSEGFLFGQPVSGMNPGARLLQPVFTDASGWTGGDFGPEASVQLAVLVTLACVGLLVVRRART